MLAPRGTAGITNFHQAVRTLREFLLARLRGSRENWTPPPVLRLTK